MTAVASPDVVTLDDPADRTRICERILRVLSRILHGIDDDGAHAVLANVAAAARPGARVLILDAVLPEGDEPHPNKWLDLLMLVLAGGRERTAAEWPSLLEGAGLRVDRLDDGLVEASCP